MIGRGIAVAVALAASSASAAVTYRLELVATLPSGPPINGIATLSVPRHLVQPDPPAYRDHVFLADRLDGCSLTARGPCVSVSLASLLALTGDYGVSADILGFSGSIGAFFPTAALDRNGSYVSVLSGMTTGILTISGAPTLVPEPSSWALLVTGFGLVGAVLRRRYRTA